MFGRQKKQEIPTTAIIVAAGNSVRMGEGENKQLIEIHGMPIIAHTLAAFEAARTIDDIILVTREQDIILMNDIVREFSILKLSKIIPGGETRQQSVMRGLNEVGSAHFVAIHDGARPCILPEQIDDTVMLAIEKGASALSCKATDTLKEVQNGIISRTVNRQHLWRVQTPQVFPVGAIKKAHQYAEQNGISSTDDTYLMEVIGEKVFICEGDERNMKITTINDLPLVSAILEQGFDENV